MDGTHRFALAALVGAVALAAFGQLARTETKRASDLSGPTGGLVVTRVQWLSDERDASLLAGARLVVSPAPSEVRIRIGAPGPWVSCRTRGRFATCAFTRPFPRVRDARALEVVALG